MYTEKNDIRTYISYTLLPALYERLEQEGVLDEFKFKYKKTRAVSTTTHRYTGRTGKSAGQVVIYEANPGYLIDNSEAEKTLDIISYIQHVKHGEDIGFIKALDELANMAGVKPYRRTLTEEEKIALEKANRRAKVWQSAVNFCIQCIQDVQYKEEAKPIIDYLTKARSYTIDDVVAMQLGYLPGQAKLNAYLEAQGFSKEEIKDTIQLPAQAGSTNRLTIPIKNRNGRPIGLAIRNANYTGEGAKYVYNTGLTKSEALFNLHSKAKNKSVVLVEGQLDAAIAEARGFTLATVAALGGKTISVKQIDHLITAGAEKIFICLDNEEETKPQTKAIISELIKVEELAQNIYIAQLPAGVKDVDELITKEGIEALEEVIIKATPYYDYLGEEILNNYLSLKATQGELTGQNIHQAIEDVERVAATISSPTRRDDLKNRFVLILEQLGVPISAEAFTAAVDRIRYKDDLAKQSIEINKTLKAAQKHNDEGRQKEALKELDNVRQLKLINKITEYKALDEIDHSEEALIKIINDKPEAVDTGYTVNIDGEITPIKIEASQLTFIAAATGHGKTSFLINTALNVVKAYPEKIVYLFTYEQPADEILVLALNTYVGEALNNGNNNRRTIKDYYRGDIQYIAVHKRQSFINKKDDFFKNIVPRLKIRQTDYSADELIQFIHYVKKQNENAVILIDYVQKLRSDKKGSLTNRPTELTFICEDLNEAAIQSGLPIALGAQFNREVQAPLDMHPTKLAEASIIEKTASEIIGLWNCTKSHRKLDNKEEKTLKDLYNIQPGVREDAIILEVLKSRSIGTGHIIKLAWHGNSGKITQEAQGINAEANKDNVFI